MKDKTRILIADDHPMFREGVVQSISKEKKFIIVGQASSGKETVKLAAELLPDVLLLDITMPHQNGIDVAKQISAKFPFIQIIMLTASENEDDLMKALKAGARGYVLKGISEKELVNVVHTIAKGELISLRKWLTCSYLSFHNPISLTLSVNCQIEKLKSLNWLLKG